MSDEKKAVKCAYCRKEIPGVPHRAQIVSRMWKPSYKSPMRDYCNKQCASHDQMAHEG